MCLGVLRCNLIAISETLDLHVDIQTLSLSLPLSLSLSLPPPLPPSHIAVAAAVSHWQELKVQGKLDQVEEKEEEDIYAVARVGQVLTTMHTHTHTLFNPHLNEHVYVRQKFSPGEKFHLFASCFYG